MLTKPNSKSNSTLSSSNLTNISKCTNTNSNPPEPTTVSGQFNLWPPSETVIDTLVLKLKAKVGDTEANWEKIMVGFKKELVEEARLKTVDDDDDDGDAIAIDRGVKGRAKFCVPLSRTEMEKDFEDMGERRLPRKPKKRPKVVQNRLDTLFPGLWLTEIHADLYRVSETKKR